MSGIRVTLLLYKLSGVSEAQSVTSCTVFAVSTRKSTPFSRFNFLIQGQSILLAEQ